MGKMVGGGVENFVMNYYRNIDRDKIQFDFICDEDSTNIPYEEIKALGGVVILIPPYQKIFSYQKSLSNVLRMGNYKIVHSHINTLSIFSLFAAARAKVPIRIAHSHSTSNPCEYKKNIIKNILRPFSKLYATDYFACSDEAGIYQFGKRAFNKRQVTIINNAIDIEKYQYNEKVRKEFRKRYGIEDNCLVLGHVGRFATSKNHNLLIDILKLCVDENKNIVLLLAGSGPLEDKIKYKVAKLNLTDNVRFLGQIDNVEELLQGVDIFVLPSLYEGLGLVLIEAQAAGCYVVASSKVPDKARVSDKFKFVSLQDDDLVWSKEILNIKIENRDNNFANLEASGYNIKKEAIKLEKIYKKLIDESDKSDKSITYGNDF